jgi:hypothetical protein
VQVRLKARCGGEPIINDLGFAVNTDFGTFPELATQMVTELDAAIGTSSGTGVWFAGLATGYYLEAIEVADVKPGTAAGVQVATGYPGAVSDGDTMPPNDGLCISLRSVYRGPGGRGRIYLAGWPESYAASGYWTIEAQNAASAIASALNTAFGELGTGSFRWCIIHRTSNGGVLHAPVVKLAVPEIKPIMDWTVHNEVRSIGRRAVGRRIRRVRATV